MGYLLGDDDLDEELLLGRVARHDPLDSASDGPEHADSSGHGWARLVDGGAVTVHSPEGPRGMGRSLAVDALRRHGRIVLDCELPGDAEDARALVASLVREATLTGAVVAGPLPEHPRELVRDFEGAEVPVLLNGHRTFDSRWAPRGRALPLDPLPENRLPLAVWAKELAEELSVRGDTIDLNAVGALRVGPDQVRRSVAVARAFATADQVPLAAEHLRRGARHQAASTLDAHARRVEPQADWSGLVLPEIPLGQFHELALRARQRDRVLR